MTTTFQEHNCAARRSSVLVGPDKRALFDRYWETRDLSSADLRTRLRIGIVERFLTGARGTLLDVGCGRGAVASQFAELGFNVTAVDISPLAVRWTERQHPLIKAAVLDLETEPLNGTYDAILCLEVLQQVRDPVSVLTKLRDALAADGALIVSLPNEFHLVRRLAILWGRVNFGGIEDTHIKFYTPAEHQRLFATCGLTVGCSSSQSIVPPRWLGGWPHRAGNVLANRWPGLFSLSRIYRLRPCTVGVHGHPVTGEKYQGAGRTQNQTGSEPQADGSRVSGGPTCPCEAITHVNDAAGTFSERFPILFDPEGRLEKAEKVIAVLSDYWQGGVVSKTVVDVGCSTGIMTRRFASAFGRVIGLDTDGVGVGNGARLAVHAGIGPGRLQFCGGDGCRMPLADSSVDGVICNQVYEHVDDQTGLMDEIWRVLRPGGVCYFGIGTRHVLIEGHYKLPFLSWLPHRLADIYMKLAGKRVRYDVRLLSYRHLCTLVRGFKVVDYTVDIIKRPQQFADGRRGRVRRTVQRGPVWLLNLILPLIPVHVWVLVKPSAESPSARIERD